MIDTLEPPSLAVQKSYLQAQVADFLHENPGLMYINSKQPSHIYIGVKKGVISEKRFRSLLLDFFKKDYTPKIKNKNNKLGVTISYKDVTVPENYVVGQTMSASRTPVPPKKIEQVEKTATNKNEILIKRFARLGLSLSLYGEELVSTFPFQQDLFLQAQQQDFEVEKTSFMKKVISDILKRGDFIDDLLLAKSLLKCTGISFKSFEEEIYFESARFKDGRSYPIEFSSVAQSNEAHSFLKNFFAVNRCDEKRLFLVNRVPFLKIIKALSEHFNLTEGKKGDRGFTHNPRRNEITLYGVSIRTVFEKLQEIFPHVSFSYRKDRISYLLREVSSKNSTKKQTKKVMGRKGKSKFVLTQMLQDMGIMSVAQKKNGVYYVGVPARKAISLCNITPELMEEVKEKFQKEFSDTYDFVFKEKSVKYSLKEATKSVSSEPKVELLPEEKESASKIVYKSIVDLLPLLDEAEKKSLSLKLDVQTELSKKELLDELKKHNLVAIEGGKVHF